MNYIPELKDLIVSLISATIVGVIIWVWNKLKTIPSIKLPGWLFGFMLIFIIVSIILATYNVFEKRTLTKVVDKEFGTEKVVLDGKKFINCKFIRSELIIKGQKKFQLRQCEFYSPTFNFDENAALTIEIIEKLKDDPAFKPLLDEIYKVILQ